MDKHLSLSFELIYLMGWLLEHEKGMLNSLIKHAIKNGLAQDLEKVNFDMHDNDSSKDLQAIILDFLSFLERSLAKNLDALDIALAEESNHQDHGNNTDHEQDNTNLRTRLKQATQLLAKKLESKNESSKKTGGKKSQQSAFNEILKNWKPSKRDLVH